MGEAEGGEGVRPGLARRVQDARGDQERGVRSDLESQPRSGMGAQGGQQRSFKFNYKDVLKGKHIEQNILLKPGDTVIVP